MAVELHQKQAISYKLQMRKIEGRDSPHLHSSRLEAVSIAIQFLLSWHATADRASQGYAMRITSPYGHQEQAFH